jgi:hypothetical protein
MFWRRNAGGKRARGTNALHVVVLACGLVMVLACLPDAHQIQMRQLLGNLVAARAALSEEPPRIDSACDAVGDVQSRLLGSGAVGCAAGVGGTAVRPMDYWRCAGNSVCSTEFEPGGDAFSAGGGSRGAERVGRRVREIARRGPGSRS